MKLSVVIPARNEEGCIQQTVTVTADKLISEGIPFEIIVVDDNSTDTMPALCDQMAAEHDWFRAIHRKELPGVGRTIAEGLRSFSGDVVAIMMADGSDSEDDLVTYYRIMEEKGCDCVFGSRWMKGGVVVDYPLHKRVINRLANHIIKLLFWIPYDDITNAFKVYKKEVIEGVRPLLSYHFNILAEIPLKAIVRGFSFEVTPISWKNRKTGVAKLKIKEMGSRYMFIVLYVLLEKWLSRQDYVRDPVD